MDHAASPPPEQPAQQDLEKALRALDKDALLAVALDALARAGAAPFAAALASHKADGSPPRKKSRHEKKKGGGRRPMDFGRYAARDIALWIAYDGGARAPVQKFLGGREEAGNSSAGVGRYCGFAEQNLPAENVETVEKHLFAALKKVCLVESKESCGYSRCGRTDKGVSAVGQVIGLRVRSAGAAGEVVADLHPGEALPSGKAELDYVGMLNRVLPADVRALAWAPVKDGFSARFSCGSRTYRYWLPRRDALSGRPRDLAAMRRAAEKLAGEKDFRNFCKMDIVHVSNFVRLVYGVQVTEEGPLLRVEVHGQAFLWHMVRCFVAVLALVGDGREEPSVVDALLDVERCPRRPQYLLADERPLVLHDCAFDTLAPLPTPDALLGLHAHLAARRDEAAVVLARRENALSRLDGWAVRVGDLDARLARAGAAPSGLSTTVPWPEARAQLLAAEGARAAAAHRPLLAREGGKTFDEKVAGLSAKRREMLEANQTKRAAQPEGTAFHDEKRRCG